MTESTTYEPTQKTICELDQRETCDEVVQLFWLPKSNRIMLRVTDKIADRMMQRVVPNVCARDAFAHPHVFMV